MAFTIRGEIVPYEDKRVYEVTWDDGVFTGDELPLSRIEKMQAFGCQAKVTPTGPSLDVDPSDPVSAYVAAHFVLDRIVSERGDLPDLPDYTEGDPPGAIY